MIGQMSKTVIEYGAGRMGIPPSAFGRNKTLAMPGSDQENLKPGSKMSRNKITALLLTALIPAAVPAADWPVFRGNSLQNGIASSSLPEELEKIGRASCRERV